MRNELVSDADVEKALDWLRDNAETIGKAKAEAVRADHMLKHIKALAMKLHGEMGVSAQEREALASEQYRTAIDTAATAAGEYERLKALREAAALKIEAWRTASSNYRSMKI
jgi:beta-phosphoglucomutase-like phosphatase (HAD superfamily)